MKNNEKNPKTVLYTILATTVVLPLLFFASIQIFHLTGLFVFFLQLALYTLFYALAYWGIVTEKIVLALNGKKIRDAIGILLAGWLCYVLILVLSSAVSWTDEMQKWQNTPIWKAGAQILSDWFFVGMAEEILFRGYFLTAFRRHFIRGEKYHMAQSILLTSAFFALWHVPVRTYALIMGEISLLLLLTSLIALFVIGTGFAWLFVRTQNILAAGLVHGAVNYPLLGAETQLSFIILAMAIVFGEMRRWMNARTMTDPEQKQ